MRKHNYLYLLIITLLSFNMSLVAYADRESVGINLTQNVDYAPSIAFVDAMKSSRGWAAVNARYKRGGVKLGPQGWPQEDAAIVLNADVPNLGGIYKISFAGKADLRATDGGTIKNLSYNPSTDTTTAEWEVEKDQKILALEFKNTQGGVRDVKVLRDWEADGVFTKRFTDLLKPFSLIRFMNWTATNNSRLSQWNDRATIEHAVWSDVSMGAVPLEVCIDLINRTNKDGWFCIPHLADDDYVRNMARLLRDTVNPNLRIYVEYSNELWNFQFKQTNYYKKMAGDWFTEQVSQGVYTEDKRNQTMYPQMWKLIADRSTEVMKIVREEFGDTDRLVTVIGSQAAGPHIAKSMLEHGDTAKHHNALAIAPYFLHSHGYKKLADTTLERGLDGIFEDIREELDGKNKRWIEQNANHAKKHGLSLIAYEGGPHMVVHSQDKERDRKLNALFMEANRDPRMVEVYHQHYRNWKAAGGELYTFYSLMTFYGTWGYWGLLENMDQDYDSVPKYRAVKEIMEGKYQATQ